MNCSKMLRIVGVALAVSIIVSGCQVSSKGNTPEPWPSSLDPGIALCSRGIIPGQTSLDQAEKILTELGYTVQHCPVGSCITWHGSKSSPDRVFGRANNGVVAAGASKTVTFVSVGFERTLSLEEMLYQYGAPENYLAYETYLTLLEGGHAPAVLLALYYPRQGLVFEAWVPGQRQKADINPQTLLTWAYCFPPTSLDRLLEDVPDMKQIFRWGGPLRDWEGTESIYIIPFDPR